MEAIPWTGNNFANSSLNTSVSVGGRKKANGFAIKEEWGLVKNF